MGFLTRHTKGWRTLIERYNVESRTKRTRKWSFRGFAFLAFGSIWLQTVAICCMLTTISFTKSINNDLNIVATQVASPVSMARQFHKRSTWVQTLQQLYKKKLRVEHLHL